MKKENNDKIKKLFDDIKELSDRLENLSILGEIKDIKKIGNSTHILMNKNLEGKKALVIVLPNFEKI